MYLVTSRNEFYFVIWNCDKYVLIEFIKLNFKIINLIKREIIVLENFEYFKVRNLICLLQI